MKSITSQLAVSLLAFASVATAQHCPGFTIRAVTSSTDANGGLLYNATDYGAQYLGPPSEMAPTMFNISFNGSLRTINAQCVILPYITCRPTLTIFDANQWGISSDNTLAYGGDTDFLVCPHDALQYYPATAGLPATTTLTQSTQVASGTTTVPTPAPTAVDLRYVLLATNTTFVNKIEKCEHARLVVSDCAGNGTDVPPPSAASANGVGRIADAALVGNVLGGAALVGAFLL